MARIAPCSTNQTAWTYATVSGTQALGPEVNEIASSINRERNRRGLAQSAPAISTGNLIYGSQMSTLKALLEQMKAYSNWGSWNPASGQLIVAFNGSILKNNINDAEDDCVCDTYHSNCHSDCHSNCNCHGDCHSNCNCNCHSDCNSNCHGNCHSNCNCNCHTNCYSNCHGDCHGDCHSNCNCFCWCYSSKKVKKDIVYV